MAKQFKRVLVVDDRLYVRKVVKMVLASNGVHQVVEAVNGRDALQQLLEATRLTNPNKRDGGFDLVICDWNMPEMTGIELLAEMRKDIRFQTIPFLMVTGQGDREDIMQAVEAGVTDFIVKPFTIDTLEKKLRRMQGGD